MEEDPTEVREGVPGTHQGRREEVTSEMSVSQRERVIKVVSGS